MPRVSATEFVRNFPRYRHEAHREPVAVTDHGRPVGSPEAYAEIEELRARQILSVGQFPDEVVRELRSASMESRHAHLDTLMDD